MAKPRNKLIDYLQYSALRMLGVIGSIFGLQENYRTARFLGDLVYRLDRRHRIRAVEHLRRSFPSWDEQRLQATARESFRHMMYLGVEMLFTPRMVTPYRWRRHIRLKGVAQFVRLLLRRESPTIVITGHFGGWEVAGYTLAALGFRSVALYRPLDNKYLDAYVRNVREHRGLRLLSKKGATEELDGVLAANMPVSFVADQDAGRKGLYVDFFGRAASTYKAPGLLAMQYDAPVAVVTARRLEKPFTFEMELQRIIEPHEWAEADDPLRWITRQYNKALEDGIKKAPEQYLWVHRRWKHRPRGEQRGPDGIA
ncbi:MAG: lysophospholipid acyltransferase family protein [Phycisphaerae bacterium]